MNENVRKFLLLALNKDTTPEELASFGREVKEEISKKATSLVRQTAVLDSLVHLVAPDADWSDGIGRARISKCLRGRSNRNQ